MLFSPVSKLPPWEKNFNIILNKNILSESFVTSPNTLQVFTDGSKIGTNVGFSVIVSNENKIIKRTVYAADYQDMHRLMKLKQWPLNFLCPLLNRNK